MKKPKILVSCLAAVHILHAATILQGIELLSSHEAWTQLGVQASSNNGKQNNTYKNGGFVKWGGACFFCNQSSSGSLEMRATAANPQQNYTAGYTYSYQSVGHSAIADYNTTFNAELLANGVPTGENVSGNNFTVPGTAGSNTLSGELQVESDFTYLGQQIAMRISSQGVQTRWRADGSTSLSALLTNHANFDGGVVAGALYSTSFSGGAQVIEYDHVLDMRLTKNGGAIEGDKFRINNSHVNQNTVSFGSETDTFRADTKYTISIEAKKHISQDASQNSIDIVMGGGVHTETITISPTRNSYTCTVTVDDTGLKGKGFNFDITASDKTSTGQTNQYHIYAFSIKAVSSVH
jgi:hypothetical protein